MFPDVLQAFPYLYIPIDSGLPETTSEGADIPCFLLQNRTPARAVLHIFEDVNTSYLSLSAL